MPHEALSKPTEGARHWIPACSHRIEAHRPQIGTNPVKLEEGEMQSVMEKPSYWPISSMAAAG